MKVFIVLSVVAGLSWGAPERHSLQKRDLTPTFRAALAYLAEQVNLDGCGEQFKAYINTNVEGDREAAAEAAAEVYKSGYAAGQTLSPACQAAEAVWREKYAAGEDPLLPSALAFIDAYPVQSACGVSAGDYIRALTAGKTAKQAALAAFKSFAAEIVAEAEGEQPTVDAVCVKASQAYIESSGIPDGPNKAAMLEYISQALESGEGFDPVCLEAAKTYIEVYSRSGSDSEANDAAAVTFLNKVSQSDNFDENSACGRAANVFVSSYNDK